MCILETNLFVYSQVQTQNLQIRIPMNNKSCKNKGVTCFPRISSLANAAQSSDNVNYNTDVYFLFVNKRLLAAYVLQMNNNYIISFEYHSLHTYYILQGEVIRLETGVSLKMGSMESRWIIKRHLSCLFIQWAWNIVFKLFHLVCLHY
jgi:hypothetical protein